MMKEERKKRNRVDKVSDYLSGILEKKKRDEEKKKTVPGLS